MTNRMREEDVISGMAKIIAGLDQYDGNTDIIDTYASYVELDDEQIRRSKMIIASYGDQYDGSAALQAQKNFILSGCAMVITDMWQAIRERPKEFEPETSMIN